MDLDSELTVRGLVVHAVDVPMNRPLKTGGGEVGSLFSLQTRKNKKTTMCVLRALSAVRQQ